MVQVKLVTLFLILFLNKTYGQEDKRINLGLKLSIRSVISYSTPNQMVPNNFEKGVFGVYGIAVSKKIGSEILLSGIDFHTEYIPPNFYEYGPYGYANSFKFSYLSWPLGILFKLTSKENYPYFQILNNMDFNYYAVSTIDTATISSNIFCLYRDFVETDIGLSFNNRKQIMGLLSIGFSFYPFFQKEIVGNNIKFTQFNISLILQKRL